MSNPILKAIERLEKSVLAIVKRRMVQEAPQVLIAFYNEFLQPTTKPDRKAKSGRLYFSRPNSSNKLRTQYGNIQRALQPGETGNITEVAVTNGVVTVISGINEDATVQAGPDRVSLQYARFHEEGTKNYKARPFLNPGFELFIKEGLPDIVAQIEDDLVEEFNGG